MNLAACPALPRTIVNSFWYRMIFPGYIKTALSSDHTKAAQSRFNAGSLLAPADRFAALYFADDPLVAQFEVGALLGSPMPGAHIPHPRKTFVTLNVQVVLNDVLDITDESSAHGPLDTTAQELTGDWRGYQTRSHLTPIHAPIGHAPTQVLGKALFHTGAEGFLAISAKVPYHQTLVVFVDKMKKGSLLRFTDSSTGALMHEIRP